MGRMIADGTGEEPAYAARMDTWIAWEAEEEAADRIPPGGTAKLFLPFFYLLFCLILASYGVLLPLKICAQRTCGDRWMSAS
jgi:hypothetical protein